MRGPPRPPLRSTHTHKRLCCYESFCQVSTGSVVQEDDAAAPLLAIAMSEEPIDTPITLFAPTNEAFAEIAGVVAGLDSDLVLAVRHFLLLSE